ncbi:MAG: hypothetical protein J5762_04070 [Clostridia bacterium]|nr:hypothetical protein [Clostridia bacterium]
MKNKKKLIAIISAAVAVVLVATIVLVVVLSGSQNKKRDSIVIMTEELSMLFNPYYATSGADMGVVGITQIGMLSTDRQGNPQAGDDLDTVVKDFYYETKTNSGSTETVYTFVIKNGLKFSDGKPLTMNDVMFNIYELLDPVYTGSSTMYSIKIKGLSKYRLQANYSGGSEAQEDTMATMVNDMAQYRRYELIDIYTTSARKGGSSSTSYSATPDEMRGYINEWPVTDGYKSAVATDAEQMTLTEDDYHRMLIEDYENALTVFKKELQSDYKAAKESFDFTTMPYSEWKDLLSSDIAKFFVMEGYITPEYADNQGKKDRTKIVKFSGTEILNTIKTEEAAINKVYNDISTTGLNQILSYWGTAGTLLTQYEAKAKDVYLRNNVTGGTLLYPNIEGVKSLGHNTDRTSVTLNGKTYNIARPEDHNADGTVKTADKYDVLEITVEGTDPKAIYSFGFTVAPAHYYSDGGKYSDYYGDNKGKPTTRIDIANNLFGVSWASSDFQSKVIQSQQHVEVPMGAGAYMATDANNSDNPKGSDFVSSNTVYYKANPNFMFPVKASKLRLQVVSSSNAIDKLVSGEVDYVTPQFTKANSERLTELEKKGYVKLSSWQLGYGYIGVNAGKIPNIYLRRAIMSAMNTKLALEFYETGTCVNIDWPMSMVSWAYPTEGSADRMPKQSKANGHTYTQWSGSVDAAKTKIENYMALAGVSAGSSDLKITFTIAGSSITEHPTYPVFKQAAEILNSCGWNVEVKADSQALTKLSTGSLSVWAAAWGSTIDPDMYQVYHKNSTATSVYSWGYREIKANPDLYRNANEEDDAVVIINKLSALIDDGRESMDQNYRKGIYEQAMSYVLDLAVEMPVYQRSTLYAYNGNTLKGLNKDVNPYSSPLEKLWEIEMA